MNRKDFLKTCGFGILGGLVLNSMNSCTTGRFIEAEATNNTIIVNKNNILENENFVLIDTPFFSTPIILVREGSSYHALLLKCTHLGCDLEVFPDKLICPCHGSEFNFKGEVLLRPAEINLRSFPVRWDMNKIMIDIKG